jgi:hypothetical protein
MKRLFLVALALMLISSVSFAQSVAKKIPSPAKEISKGIESVGAFVGKVVSVTVADPAKGIEKGTIKVADEMGNPVSYTVNSTAMILDASLNAVTLNQLKAGETVKVAAEGEEAMAITVQ